MRNYNELPEMQLVEDRLREINSYSNNLPEVSGYILGQGGKRIRPQLVLLCSDIYGAALETRVDVAVAAELIHSASLLHDDVVDNSSLRRGQPSANKRWGNSSAVLAGDLLFARAYAVLSSYPKILAIMTNAVSNMCLGELNQLYSHFNPDTTPEDYVNTIISKTASLLASSCECGAAISSMPQAEIEVIRKFALHIGIAYQILDDISDYVLDADLTGKPQGSDIRNGIVTLPLMYLLANPSTRQRVQSLIQQKQALEPKMLAPELAQTGAIEKAAAAACYHLDRGICHLGYLPSRPSVLQLEELALGFKERCSVLLNYCPVAQDFGHPRQYSRP